MKKKSYALTVVQALKKRFPHSRCRLTYRNPFELLVKTILSAQSTDDRVNEVGLGLFRHFPEPRDLAAASLTEIESHIRTTGLFRSKAKYLRQCARQLMATYDGKVPSSVEDLVALPGVGRKTANVIRGEIYNIPGVVVDTHVIRVSRRLGWTHSSNPLQIERDVQERVPRDEWTRIGHLLQDHGRATCTARRPKCAECVLRDECPSAAV